MKNANFNKDRITTLMGIFLFFFSLLVGLGILAAPVFIDVPVSMTDRWYVPYGFMGIGCTVGIILILSPDSFIRGVNKAIDKKLGS